MTSQAQAAATGAPAVLPRRFGLLQATALNMSAMIGVGPFITIPVLMAAMGGPQAMLGWVVALVIAGSDGLVWSELGAMMPGSGGSYVYLRLARLCCESWEVEPGSGKVSAAATFSGATLTRLEYRSNGSC